VHLLVGFRIHKVKTVALVVEVLELHLVQNRAFNEFFGAKAVVDDRAGAQILHARLHGAPLVSGCAVLRAVDGVQIAFVLDDHAGAEKCGFNAAHSCARPELGRELPVNVKCISEIPDDDPVERRVE